MENISNQIWKYFYVKKFHFEAGKGSVDHVDENIGRKVNLSCLLDNNGPASAVLDLGDWLKLPDCTSDRVEPRQAKTI